MYKGDLTPLETMERLGSVENSVLLDVRTMPEWNYVGVPAVQRLLTIEWQTFPSGEINPNFVAQVEQAGVPKDAEIYAICRSGVRSIAAAQALTAAGFAEVYNVLEGFEGDKDASGHRSSVGGWKYHQLPWQQG